MNIVKVRDKLVYQLINQENIINKDRSSSFSNKVKMKNLVKKIMLVMEKVYLELIITIKAIKIKANHKIITNYLRAK